MSSSSRDISLGTVVGRGRVLDMRYSVGRDGKDMDTGSAEGTELWSSAGWLQAAVSWSDEQLAAAAIVRTGEIEQPHLQPWGTVLKIPTNQGLFWLKAPGPGTAFEIKLYQLLEDVAAGRVLTPLAIDTTRNWILLPDGGRTLGDSATGPELIDALVTILPQYGQLQRDLARHVDGLVELGIADMRAAAMPTRLDRALEVVDGYVERYGEAPDREVHRRVVGLRGTFAAKCEQLAAMPVAPSLDHHDLHPWNIFVAGSGGMDRAKFYDWGDCVVAHPFTSMLVALGYLHQALEIGINDPAILRPRDAYLEVFSDLASHDELVETLELACWVGKVARALIWDRSLRAQGYDRAGEFARAPLQCLGSLLSDSYGGGTP